MYKLPLWIFVGTKHMSPLKGTLKSMIFPGFPFGGKLFLSESEATEPSGDGSWGRKRTNAYPGAELSNWTQQIAIIIIDMAW